MNGDFLSASCSVLFFARAHVCHAIYAIPMSLIPDTAAQLQQRIGDFRRALQLLEQGFQQGECRPNTDQLRALQILNQDIYKMCMVAHDEHVQSVRWPQNGAPVYSKGKYSEETLRKALDIVNSSKWPDFPSQGSALRAAGRGPFHRWDTNTTFEKTSLLQAALEIARDKGCFKRLERLCRKGLSAWTCPFFFDGGEVVKYEYWYEKTAGHNVCSFWTRKHNPHSGMSWLSNDLQAFSVTRADLPQKVLSNEVAAHVSQAGIPALAEFQEILSLYLSEDVLNLYMNVCGNACLNTHSGRFWIGCSLRDEQGLLCCNRPAPGGPGTLCSSWCEDLARQFRQGVRIADCPSAPVAVPSVGARRSRSRSRSRGRRSRETQFLDPTRGISHGEKAFRVAGRRYVHVWEVREV